MIEKTKPVNLSFCDRDGIVVAGMDLFAENDGTGPFTIPPEEATENGEAQVQLLEGAAYEYLVTNRRMRLRGQAGVVLPSRVDDSSDRGRITPSLNVGRLRFVLISTEDGSEVGSAEVEIRSIKVGYRDEYRQMLEYITERCNDLLLEFRSPAMQNVLPEDTREPDTICQRFAFVRSLVTSRRFRDAVSRVIALPHRLWEQEEEQVPIGRGVKPSASIARQIASASRRIPLAASHPLRSRIPSVPEQVTILRIVESVDTAENRFVKHALRMFQAFAADTRQLLEHFHRESDTRFIGEASALEEELGEILSRDFFRAVSDPEILPLGSPVLQRKGGYREILAAWLQFDMAARLHWRGGDDVYGAGKRDVATLYEYWLFFRLLEMVAGVFHLDKPPAESLIEFTEDGFGLKLRSGHHIALRGDYTAEDRGRKLKVRLSYNRTYPRKGLHNDRNFPLAGSWTERMRPDFSLSLWPDGFTEEEAEKQEVVVHVHFDAKYRVKDLADIFGDADDTFADDEAMERDIADEKAFQKRGTYRRADLLKMHAYKDAIRRTAGAYVLYPGTQNRNWQGFHEIVPGLGAFGVRPVEEGDDGTAALTDFILKVADHVCDRATQRERETYHRYDIHRDPPTHRMVKELPEHQIGSFDRHLPPDDTMVMKGFIRPTACRVCREKGVFYFHAVDERGRPAEIDTGVLQAQYLFPFSVKAKWLGWYAPIDRCELVTQKALERIVGRGILVRRRPYYYLIRLDKRAIVDITECPTVSPPKPGIPTLCSWAELYAKNSNGPGDTKMNL